MPFLTGGPQLEREGIYGKTYDTYISSRGTLFDPYGARSTIAITCSVFVFF